MSSKIKNTVTVNGKRYVCKIYYLSECNDYSDCYTIIFKGYRVGNKGIFHPYIGCSIFGNYYHGELTGYNTKEFKHLGKQVAFSDLPEAVQKVIINELTGK